ncbi:hypothetical protein DCC39_00120 [Pueribacillus theae]|uniref:Prepilin-type N-terminal cleavage/methylation domain-containing protein n=1 Tax=Pueribacillus theae TaxID=2171751 RepID=A0A2U1K821_9BACI|nr:competence type IV pilus minor pilin ComGD [Pueribacillus theae]PWA13339.1 hypothetical protein DCC39_00120 [Pueribacillus theae]
MALLKKPVHKMSIRPNHQQGYTLIELAIVLTIFSIIALIVIPSFSALSETKSIDHFIAQLEEDIYFAQASALSQGKKVCVEPRNSSYQIRGNNDEILLVRNHSPDIKIEKGTLNLQLCFIQNGNVPNFGTWIVRTKKESYKLTFYIGKGRFHVSKL